MNRAGKFDKPLVVQILCAAFDSNKSINYIAKQDSRREERIKILMEYSFELAMKFGEVYLSDNRQACALILFPEKRKTDLSILLLDLNLAVRCIGLSRIGKVLEKEKKTKACHPSGPMLHLWFLGVMPGSQGKGLGKKLLATVIELARSLDRPVYLETSMLPNLSFYKNMGFEIYNQIDLGYTIFLLRRNLSKT